MRTGATTALRIRTAASRGEDGPTPEEEARWAALQETIPQLRADFITRNGLEPFDEAALLAGPFTYEGEHRYLEYSGTCGTYVLALSQPERQGEGESGAWSGGTGPAAAPAWCSLSRTARPPPRSTPRGRRNGTAATYPTTRRRARPSTG